MAGRSKRLPHNVRSLRARGPGRKAGFRGRGHSGAVFRLKGGFGFIAFAAVLGVYGWTNFAPAARTSFALFSSPAIVGGASIVDGDTLDVQGQRIRLFGIDAPEGRQTCHDGDGRDYRCGERATRALVEKIAGQVVSCDQRDVDRYGRIVGVCRAGGEDLNGWLVREGLAVAYTRYSVKYVPAETAARLAGRGLWAGDFMAPEEWRRQSR